MKRMRFRSLCSRDEFSASGVGSISAEIRTLTENAFRGYVLPHRTREIPTFTADDCHWSYSPYTALFFALAADEADTKATGRCAIFEIDVAAFCFAMSYMLHKDEAAARAPSARDDAFANSLGFDNPRILEFEHTENKRKNRQSGVFIFLNESIEDLMSYEQKCISQHPDCEFLSKYTLSNSERQKGVGQLYLMGHSSSNIYVDETRATFDATNFVLTNM